MESYMIYRTAPFSMTLNDPYLQFEGRAILWRWISHKRFDIQTQFQWNTNRDLHTPYSTVSFRTTLSDLAKYSMTRIVARSLCDSWASCSGICYQTAHLMICASLPQGTINLTVVNRWTWLRECWTAEDGLNTSSNSTLKEFFWFKWHRQHC